MASKPSQQPKGRDSLLSTLDVLIQALGIAKDTCGIPPAQIAIGSANVLLTMIRVRPITLSNIPLIYPCIGFYRQQRGLSRPRGVLR